MNTDSIFSAVKQLREVAGDGPAERKVVDALFRHVHNLKANASANGLNELAAAAHEFENVLHSMRTRAMAGGARLFQVQAIFDVADFDQKFQSLKETLSNTGEVIFTSPSMDNESHGKLKFKILYAEPHDARQTLSGISGLIVEEITIPSAPSTSDLQTHASFESAFEKLSDEIAKLPATLPGDVFVQAVRAGRSAALALGKEVDFEVRGQDVKLDYRLSEVIRDTLVHLIRNAVDHGIETSGKILIEVVNRDGQTRIKVIDNGRGMDPTLIQQIFQPGVSTASQISEISGRGVGLDAAKTAIEDAGGSITVTSQIGHGSTFEITLPSKSNPR
ncbi:MAG TPA: ATP-binding protein [Pyrinomonadaceae bacterium]|nr:ATP-binding protein [Pyrinomonadaceae bacterium]